MVGQEKEAPSLVQDRDETQGFVHSLWGCSTLWGSSKAQLLSCSPGKGWAWPKELCLVRLLSSLSLFIERLCFPGVLLFYLLRLAFICCGLLQYPGKDIQEAKQTQNTENSPPHHSSSHKIPNRFAFISLLLEPSNIYLFCLRFLGGIRDNVLTFFLKRRGLRLVNFKARFSVLVSFSVFSAFSKYVLSALLTLLDSYKGSRRLISSPQVYYKIQNIFIEKLLCGILSSKLGVKYYSLVGELTFKHISPS